MKKAISDCNPNVDHYLEVTDSSGNLHRLANAFQHSTDSIVFTDKDGVIVDVNPAFAEMYGYKPNEVLGKTNRVLRSSKADSKIYDKMWEAILREKQWKGELFNKRKDGTEFPVYLSITPIYDSEELTGYMGLTIDLTDKYRIGVELEHEKRFSESLLETANNLIVGLDTKGNITLFNKMCEELTRYKRSDVMGKSWFEIFLPASNKRDVEKIFQRLLKTGEPKSYENEIVTKVGEKRLILWSNTTIMNEDEKVIGTLSIGQDTTEYTLLRKGMAHSEQLAIVGQLAAGIAHEVGNPLTSISSIAQVLQRQVKEKSVLEKLNMIRGQTRRITQIIRDLVDFSRPTEMSEEPTDVNVQVEKALRIVQLDEKSKHVRFNRKFDTQLPALFLIPDQLFQVILNLLLNAIDALEDNKGTISVRTSRGESDIIITVKDTGRGVPRSDQERIFEPFYTTKEVGRGTGLGLWVSQGIMDSFGGSINVESEIGVGATFIVRLPLSNLQKNL